MANAPTSFMIDRAMQRVRTLGLVYVLLGVIELAWALFCVFGGALLGLAGFADDRLGPVMWLGGGAYVLLALAAAIMGTVHVVAGGLLRRGRGMIAAIVGLAACLPSMVLALYCFPFSLGALVYGIVVLLDADARRQLDAGP